MQEETKQNRLQELEALVAREQDRLFRFAYLRVGNRADAEDIVQEVFLKLYRSEERLHRVRQLERYLLRAVNNACRDFHRKRQYNLIPLDEAGPLPESEEDKLMHETYLRIGKVMENLPEEQAEIVRLKCTDGLKFREIASILDIPVATAKSRYRYAIAHLQQTIKK